MICFYHRGDLDGHCSGAIVRHNFPGARMIGIDYEDEFPWDKVPRGADVCMVDFSLPMEHMRLLQELTVHRFVWIDHHKTVIDKAKEAGFSTAGLRVVGEAACELTWEYFTPSILMPHAVRLLGRYDVFDLEKWLVNLYTYREDVNVGEIAKKYGGGGHQKAAGFICSQLPFEI